MKSSRRDFLKWAGGILPIAGVGLVGRSVSVGGSRKSDSESQSRKPYQAYIQATYEAQQTPGFSYTTKTPSLRDSACLALGYRHVQRDARPAV
jgi:hypothetical protein